MRTIVINARRLHEKEAAHAYLKRRLRLAEYHGSNLDALFDVLSSVGRDTRILFGGTARAGGDYAGRVLAVFEDAAAQNPHITVKVLS